MGSWVLPWAAPRSLTLALEGWKEASCPLSPASSPCCYAQALAFPDQLYDAVFDGAEVTSKTPIRLYGGALLSKCCWGSRGQGGQETHRIFA